MGAIVVRVYNASRLPLDDRMDVHVVSAATDATVAVATDVPGASPVRFDMLVERQAYLVKVFPVRHRPVAEFAFAGDDGRPSIVELHAPLHPEHVRAATFPEFGALHDELQDVLGRSAIAGASGELLYAALGNTGKAGLLNLFAKMSHVTLGGGRSVWSFVDSVFDVRGDRIFVDVRPELHEEAKAAAAAGRFREASGALHTPPPGFAPAGSFKTRDPYGNLQLTFFSSLQPPAAFKVDADIDDAAGLGHAFQVIRNFMTQGTTHPYDIHQILVFRQDATLPYHLV